MAVATPVLERKVSVTESGAPQTTTYRRENVSSDEIHNARIKDNYARLINPDFKIEDYFAEPQIKAAAPAAEPVVEVRRAPVQEKPQLVENARADAAIFRADSEINRVAPKAEVVSAEQTATDDEDNEDLRPTRTTIQYRTLEESDRKSNIKVVSSAKDNVLGKKEKIIIGTFIAIVVALFVLVIINSAIIANINSEMSAIQNSIVTVKGALASVNGNISSIITPENIAEFAESHNLILK